MHSTSIVDEPPRIDYPATTSNTNTAATGYRVIRRNGKLTHFDRSKIQVAITKAYLAVEGGNAAASRRVHEIVARITEQVVEALFRHLPDEATVHIENIQDQVELALMRNGEHKVARAYVLYREQHAQLRAASEAAPTDTEAELQLVGLDGQRRPLDRARLQKVVEEAVTGFADIKGESVLQAILHSAYDGMQEQDFYTAQVMAVRDLIDREPAYTYVAARLLLDNGRREALSTVYGTPRQATQQEMSALYADYFRTCIGYAIEHELLDPALAQFDLERLAAALEPARDFQFTYLGLQTLYDRYFIHHEQQRLELPQVFFMRVAMGLAINEIDREQRCIEFYHQLSRFDFMSSTPTLFNSGTLRPQLSSCYLTTIPDDLDGIYGAMKDNALLSKYAGGLGNDWTRVRGLGAHIKGTNGQSQGVVPFLKVANDTAVAVNQGGKRKGAVCAYLETWHIDIEEFLELRKNTGDDRRRTHDMNTANWIPDLFMKRVVEEGDWTLFSPDETPDLHDLYGNAFEQTYTEYEARVQRGEIRVFRVVKAVELWRKMLGMLFETGHPWITFKDPCNIRYTNQHVGPVHSSNLCTEITLHTNDHEIAVCNLGSINLAAHVNENGLDEDKLRATIGTAMRMLDNVIDYNYYGVSKARNANLRHRPVGLGIMGFQDALYKLNIPYADQRAVDFADRSMEAVSYFAIEASSKLAVERGCYSSYNGSLWSRGILPQDSIDLLAEQRGNYLDCDRSSNLDWNSLRETIKQQGLRNSNCLAIAPTATISNICGVSQSIEPAYQNLYVKSNLSGEFTLINPYLVDRLREHGVWDEVMVNDLKYYDGSVQHIDRVPDDIKALFATAFEIDTRWLIEAAARRQKWIDQAQSLNLYLAEPSGKMLDQIYKLAWVRGLKTTYYLRSMGATHMEKTMPRPEAEYPDQHESPRVCSILDPDCEACQ